MRPNRLLAPLIVTVVAVALAACGGNSPSASNAGGDNGPSSAANPSSAAASNAGNQGGTTDLQSLANDLKPPNASQTANLSTATTIVVTYTTSDSIASLKSFYDKALADAGLTVMGTTDAGGAFTWIVTNGANTLGGTVTAAPDTSGSGSSVSVAIGSE
jgi:hypothetical protein